MAFIVQEAKEKKEGEKKTRGEERRGRRREEFGVHAKGEKWEE